MFNAKINIVYRMSLPISLYLLCFLLSTAMPTAVFMLGVIFCPTSASSLVNSLVSVVSSFAAAAVATFKVLVFLKRIMWSDFSVLSILITGSAFCVEKHLNRAGFLLHRINITTKISITRIDGTTMATISVASETKQIETVVYLLRVIYLDHLQHLDHPYLAAGGDTSPQLHHHHLPICLPMAPEHLSYLKLLLCNT